MLRITSQRSCCACGQNKCRFLYRTRLSPGPVVQCLNCGLIYINLVEHPERLAIEGQSGAGDLIYAGVLPIYQQLYLAEAEVKRRLYNQTVERIESLTGETGTLLDIGSYMGLFMKTAVERGWQCKGVEPELEAWEYSVQKLGLDACWGTLNTCEFPPQSFNAVTMLQVLEHIADPRQTLQQIHGLLRPGGVLLVEVPNIDCLSFKLLGKRHRHFAKHHFTFFTPKTLIALLNECGFRTLSVNFPRRSISIRLVGFGLRMWHPAVYKLVRPILNIKSFQNFVLDLNLREVVSVCAQRS